MLSADDLATLVARYNPKADTAKIIRAYRYAQEMHAPQKRSSGEPYFMHPVSVAEILTAQKLDDATIITALLHDTIEDTKSTYAEVVQLFGQEIADLVDGVTKLTNLQISSSQSKQSENFRKLLLAMSRDLRVLLVKLADRLHNMRTIKYLPIEKQQRKARETMEIYAPLAGRMGMQRMREELEDLSFQVLNPQARGSIMRRFVKMRQSSGDVIEKIRYDIAAALSAAGIAARTSGREKRPYSIWRKMEEKKEGFSRLSDIYGFRIITETEEDVYRALGVMHRRWRAVPGRFKDYISQPKSNGYRSLHTTVSGRDGKRVEIQIRTRQMHDVAETGVAAHWSYRDGVRDENPFAVDPAQWLATITERYSAAEDHEEFLEHVKLDMFSDQVFCFTPKGEVVQLPRGATPIDFAYMIHTRIGHSCVGAKVDGRRIPLYTKLRNGQSVEILTAQGQRPQSSWIEMAATGRARSAIKRALREEHHEADIRLGRELARVALEHIGKEASEKALITAAERLGIAGGAQGLLARMGSGTLPASALVDTLYPELMRDPNVALPKVEARIISAVKGQKVRRAPCCQALPGERVVGILQADGSVQAHSIQCETLAQFDAQPELWVDLQWSGGDGRTNSLAGLDVTMANGAGVLGRICTLIGEQNANIAQLHFTERNSDFYRMQIDIEIRDVAHLHNVITAVKADRDIARIIRCRPHDEKLGGARK